MAPQLPLPTCPSLVQPLIACLPAAFVSHQPPPALLELLAPILRQRVQIFSASPDSSKGSSWIPLLCWNHADGSQLTSIVQSSTFEPHPVSGEIELGEVNEPQYRCLDRETLQSRLEAIDLRLQFIYLWCKENGDDDRYQWKLAELLPLQSRPKENAGHWCIEINEAIAFTKTVGMQDLQDSPGVSTRSVGGNFMGSDGRHEFAMDDTEDEYWAQYDDASIENAITPEQIPGHFDSSTPLDGEKTPIETEYFSQYADVQPVMDNDVHTVDKQSCESSFLSCEVPYRPQTFPGSAGVREKAEVSSASHSHHNSTSNDSTSVNTSPSPPSRIVASLEHTARRQSSNQLTTLAVQQHISTNLKSLFRLSRGVGMERDEFERLVKTELKFLEMLESDD